MPELRVASYNIHRCIGTDGQFNPDRIRRVLHELDAQVIALQEVESGSSIGNIPEVLVKESSWTFIEGPTLRRDASSYGNVVLTSLPVRHYNLLDLSCQHREPRGAIDVTVECRGQYLRIIATHLGLLPSERRAQTRKLLDGIGDPDNKSVLFSLLVGDLNEWFLWGRPLRWLRSWFGSAVAPATYPTFLPLLALDRIWANPQRYVADVRSHRSPLARQASDHYPVVATLSW